MEDFKTNSRSATASILQRAGSTRTQASRNAVRAVHRRVNASTGFKNPNPARGIAFPDSENPNPARGIAFPDSENPNPARGIAFPDSENPNPARGIAFPDSKNPEVLTVHPQQTVLNQTRIIIN